MMKGTVIVVVLLAIAIAIGLSGVHWNFGQGPKTPESAVEQNSGEPAQENAGATVEDDFLASCTKDLGGEEPVDEIKGQQVASACQCFTDEIRAEFGPMDAAAWQAQKQQGEIHDRAVIILDECETTAGLK